MRLIEVGAIGEAVPRLVRAGRPRSQGMPHRTQTGARRNTSDFDNIQWRANSSSAHGFDLQPVGRFDGRYGHQRRVWPCSDCVNLEAYALCQFPVGLYFIGDLVHCTDFSDHSRGAGNTAREEPPPGSAGVPPAQDHLGARASRPHKTRHDGRDPRKGGFGALCKGVAVDGRLFAGIRCGRDARAPRWASSHDSTLASPGGVTGKSSAEALGGPWSFFV